MDMFNSSMSTFNRLDKLPFNIHCPELLEAKRVKDFESSKNGGWKGELPIPINESFSYYGHIYKVSPSTLSNAGMGLFILTPAFKGEYLFPYIGIKYEHDTWKDLCFYYPRMRTYAVEEDPTTYIVGDVLDGNVAGYINSSFNDPSIGNVIWEFDPSIPPWDNEGNLGYIRTICQRNIVPGEEILTYYEFN